MTDTPKYRLRFINAYKEEFWFAGFGPRRDAHPKWSRGPDPRRLIGPTSRTREGGMVFDTLPEALAVLVEAGDPPYWNAETLDGRAVE
jgi:hypothetical protein